MKTMVLLKYRAHFWKKYIGWGDARLPPPQPLPPHCHRGTVTIAFLSAQFRSTHLERFIEHATRGQAIHEDTVRNDVQHFMGVPLEKVGGNSADDVKLERVCKREQFWINRLETM